MVVLAYNFAQSVQLLQLLSLCTQALAKIINSNLTNN